MGKTERIKTTGLFKRKEDGDDIDHENLEVPTCVSKKCNLGCCVKFGGKDEQWRKDFVRDLRDKCRAAYTNSHNMKGHECEDQFLRALLVSKIKLAKRSNPFKTRTIFCPGKGICSLCKTFKDDELGEGNDRKHKYTKKRCPLWQVGQDIITDRLPTHVQCTLPSLGLVSVSFFRSVFLIADQKRFDRLRKGVTSCDISQHAVKSGIHGGQNRMQQVDSNNFKETVKKQELDNSHYSRFNASDDTVYVQTGVTRYSIWIDYCKEYDKEFLAQCQRLNFMTSYPTNRPPPSEEDYASDVAGKKLVPIISYHAATEWLKLYDIKFNIQRVDTCETCETFKFNLAHEKQTEEQYTKMEDDYRLHQEEADVGYAFRKQDHDDARDNANMSCADVDFGGGFRTPWVRYSSGYFKHIIPCQTTDHCWTNTSLFLLF